MIGVLLQSYPRQSLGPSQHRFIQRASSNLIGEKAAGRPRQIVRAARLLGNACRFKVASRGKGFLCRVCHDRQRGQK